VLTLPLAAEGNDVLFNHLDVNSGLPSNEVSCIYKDRKGFMWFGTSAGLTRFDGYEFLVFRHEVGSVLFSEEFILQITETADDNLWITYWDGKISVYNPRENRFRTVEELDSTLHIHKVFHESAGRLLYETTGGRLYAYDYALKQRTAYVTDQGAGGISDVVLKDDLLYVVHRSGLMEIIDTGSRTNIVRSDYLEKYHDVHRFHLFADSGGEVWVYMNPENCDGLFRFNPYSGRWTHYTQGFSRLSSSLIRAVEENADGTIWIATDHGGINLLDKKTERFTYLRNHPFDSRSVSQNSVICLYRDDNDILWCGTHKNGISYCHESIFKFNSLEYPVSDETKAGINDFNCIYHEASGNLWIGTNGHGLLYYDRSDGSFRQYLNDPSDPRSLSSNIIVCLAGDREGRLWIGTYMGGLNYFDGRQFVRYTADDAGGLSNNSVYALHLDSSGDGDCLWIGTLGGGLCRLNLTDRSWGRFTASDDRHPLLSDNIYSISRGWGDDLLVGTAVGVNTVNTKNGNVGAFGGTADGSTVFRDKAINVAFIDSRDLLWIGSNNGLAVYDRANDRLYRIDKTSGLPDNAIMSVIEDNRQALWMGTKNGLLRITPQYNGADRTFTFPCTPYYEDEGVQGRIFNRNSVCHTSAGELILGGTTGLTIFRPAQIRYNTYPPRVVISSFLVNNNRMLPQVEAASMRDISYEDRLDLRYEERSFTLTVSALNYFLPSKNRFSYKMEGFDKDWTTVGASGRKITYTNLPAGKFTFMARAENNDGTGSISPAMLRITVRPPFWATPWAILIYLVLVLLVVYLAARMIMNIQKRKFLKRQEQLAANQLHEMDEMKLRFFTNVSHEFRTPLTLIMAPLEKLMKNEMNPTNQMMLGLIHKNANQLLSLVSQLLDFRKIDVMGTKLLLSSGDIVLFIRSIIYSFKDMSEQKSIRFSFSSAFSSLIMSFDADKVFKIVSNLISNAFKFTAGGGEIIVALRLEKCDNGMMNLLVEVSDTGIGIAADQLELIFNRFYQVPLAYKSVDAVGTGIGLHICREYARVHNGGITVKSEPGKGSVFCLSLPFSQENVHEVVSSSCNGGKSGSVEYADGRKAEEGRPSVLVADDHTDFRLFMQHSLEETYNVFTASDGREAWEIVTGELPDMVVTDWMMPVMDGIELCRLIKNDIRTSHIPVILLTAKSADTNRLDGLENGADDYIEKPFNMEILRLRMLRIIEYKERMRKQFFLSVQHSIPLTRHIPVSLDEQLIRKTVSFIEEQIASPDLSVERLSREMAMSRANFYKKILSLTGKTPLELIRSVRMKYAAQLLESSGMRVSEVALRVGMNDHKLFRKYFREEFGVLPSELYGKKTSIINNINV
jgi:signal transduction histidine kinase/ligand-binding sensor domain-containing protein/DNA-binding response OmpR family regulator